MKRSITPFLAFVLLLATATAQGEWKWAHYWTGSDGAYPSYYNYITNTAFDDEGNLYVYGSMGNTPIMDGDFFEFSSQPMPGVQDAPAILLAKFDTLGNMLWYKVVKSQTEGSYPHWMEVRDNRIYISGSSSFFGSSSYAWLYFMDTLITKAQIDTMSAEERKPPFKTYSRWTFFAQFDTDGELSDCHFVEAFSREVINGIRTKRSLCPIPEVAPTHNDLNGNTYLFSYIVYGGTEADPYTIMIDGDTNRTYNLFLPGNTDRNIENAMLYKFTPEWTLDFAQLLVDHTDGIATPYEFTHDSINPLFRYYPRGLSYDDEENMYLSGRIELVLSTASHGGNLHNYPVHIWWDDSHCLNINDISSAVSANFIIKYNTDGQVVWNNQISTRGERIPDNPESSSSAYWYGNCFDNNCVYMIGTGGYGSDALVYFEDEDNYLQLAIGTNKDIAFFARYDATTGNYLNHGIVPGVESIFEGLAQPSVIGNKVLALAADAVLQNHSLVMWGNDGTFLQRDILYSSQRLQKTSVCTSEEGYIAVGMMTLGPVTIENDLTVNCSSGRSSAVIAMKYDPELLVPYVKVPEYQSPPLKLRIWPNPASSFISVDCGDMRPEIILLFDENGRELRRISCDNTLTVISLVGLPDGTYLLKAVSSDGTTAVGRFVKAE
jgi:hypothetical protein